MIRTIVIEDKLTQLFAMLPSMDGYEPVFGYGDEKELNAFLKHRQRVKPYPLIWLLYPYTETHGKNNVELQNLSFILSVQTNSSMQNHERLKVTYEKVLYPLLDNIRSLFKRSNIVNTDSSYEIIKYPNYSSTDEGIEHAGTFIWDAMKISVTLSLNDACIRQVAFGNRVLVRHKMPNPIKVKLINTSIDLFKI